MNIISAAARPAAVDDGALANRCSLTAGSRQPTSRGAAQADTRVRADIDGKLTRADIEGEQSRTAVAAALQLLDTVGVAQRVERVLRRLGRGAVAAAGHAMRMPPL